MVGALRLHNQTRDGAGPETAADDDAALVVRAKRDRESFAELYLRYVAAVYRYCYHRLGDRAAAEDATSQVFTKALTTLPGHHDDCAFRGWLFAIAHNVVVDSYRARRPTEPLDAAIALHDAGPTPEDAALAAESERTVAALLARLSPDQRDVVALRLAGLTGPEIARVLDRSLASVKIGQVRAYARLRRLLGVPARNREADDDRP